MRDPEFGFELFVKYKLDSEESNEEIVGEAIWIDFQGNVKLKVGSEELIIPHDMLEKLPDQKGMTDSIKRLCTINEQFQDKTVHGSKDWHNHETIDDICFELLEKMGD